MDVKHPIGPLQVPKQVILQDVQGWLQQTTTYTALLREMVDRDFALVRALLMLAFVGFARVLLHCVVCKLIIWHERCIAQLYERIFRTLADHCIRMRHANNAFITKRAQLVKYTASSFKFPGLIRETKATALFFNIVENFVASCYVKKDYFCLLPALLQCMHHRHRIVRTFIAAAAYFKKHYTLSYETICDNIVDKCKKLVNFFILYK